MARIFHWDRSDYRFFQGAIVLATVVVTLVAVGLPLWDWMRGNPLGAAVDTGVSDRPLPATLAAATPGAALSWDGVLMIEVAEPSTALRLAMLVPGVLLTLAAVVVAAVLLRLVVAARRQQPFNAAATRDLRIVAVVIFAAALLVPVAEGFAGQQLLHEAVERDDTAVYFAFSPGWIGLALLVLVLAEIFRIGHRLAEDVEGLV